ncbi:MAG TPA: thioredoxin domain-containing protein [Candidatus Portnoybacteria bacterium]|nr:thioredoxin domain-containing protein [Candidatus Portnoybacteria bacterium]HPH51898.1 thioredoxin domain-containing protein [Candidatus Portnoybacteria bacterium]HPM28274.1 thioredoxin domain-containing protein [Candidatus Portnoybacteria bacterium]
MNKKTYIIIIIILLVIIGFLVYNQFFGKKQTNNSNVGTIFKGDLIIGNEKAPVTIIEYYSYLCGHCKTFEDEVLPKLTENYIIAGKVKLVLRPFFLPGYNVLSQAVLCSNDQDKFLEYHNHLFANNDKIDSINALETFAETVGINKEKFSKCLESEKYKSKAEELYNQGIADFKKANIPSNQQGTPSFFINGEAVIGAMPYADFMKIIEEKLVN